MDKIKKIFNDVTGGDGKVDASDIMNQVGDLGLDDLKNLSFPITKEEIIEVLKQNNASSALIAGVEQIPADKFESLNELKGKLPF